MVVLPSGLPASDDSSLFSFSLLSKLFPASSSSLPAFSPLFFPFLCRLCFLCFFLLLRFLPEDSSFLSLSFFFRFSFPSLLFFPISFPSLLFFTNFFSPCFLLSLSFPFPSLSLTIFLSLSFFFNFSFSLLVLLSFGLSLSFSTLVVLSFISPLSSFTFCFLSFFFSSSLTPPIPAFCSIGFSSLCEVFCFFCPVLFCSFLLFLCLFFCSSAEFAPPL